MQQEVRHPIEHNRIMTAEQDPHVAQQIAHENEELNFLDAFDIVVIVVVSVDAVAVVGMDKRWSCAVNVAIYAVGQRKQRK